jgi:hypothetical protein
MIYKLHLLRRRVRLHLTASKQKRVALARGLDPKRKKEAEDRWLDGKDGNPCMPCSKIRLEQIRRGGANELTPTDREFWNESQPSNCAIYQTMPDRSGKQSHLVSSDIVSNEQVEINDFKELVATCDQLSIPII